MTSDRALSGSEGKGRLRRRVVCALSVVIAAAVAMPDQLPAAPTATFASLQSQLILQDSRSKEMLLVHCCHAHPLPPYDLYCCHAGGSVYVRPGYRYGGYYGGYYGAASVRGQARRVARRTSRRAGYYGGYRYGAASVRGQARRVGRRTGRRVSRRR